MDFVRLAMQGAYDIGIMVSRDTDLLPALETVVDLQLTRDDYDSIRDQTDYLKNRP